MDDDVDDVYMCDDVDDDDYCPFNPENEFYREGIAGCAITFANGLANLEVDDLLNCIVDVREEFEEKQNAFLVPIMATPRFV